MEINDKAEDIWAGIVQRYWACAGIFLKAAFPSDREDIIDDYVGESEHQFVEPLSQEELIEDYIIMRDIVIKEGLMD